jgi:DNA replication ATP-dependent helicase Dna2
MLYAAAETRNKTDPNWLTGRSHADLLAKFTGNLQESDMEYFRKWDRLIDLEADASSRNMATAWLTDSHSREKERGESVSGLVFDHPEPSPTQEGSRLLIAFRRGGSSPSQAPFQKIALSRGCHVIISTDGTSLVDSSHSDTPTPSPRRPKRFRHQMHIVRGIVEKVENEKLFVMARREDLERIRDLVTRHRKFCEKNGGEAYSPLPFRFDKDTSSVGIGTLRQNLINFLTADFSRKEVEQMSQASVAKQSRLPKLRDIVVRLASPKFDLRVTPDSIFRAVGPEIPGCDMDTLSAEYSRLNPDQQQAVIKVVSASDYTLIQGLPGTGKTTTLAYVARLLAARGKRVLITSYTHAAVDNVVLKLMEKGVASVNESTPVPRLVRIGQRSSCHTRVRSLLASELALQLDRIQQDRSEATMHTLSQTESYQNFDNPSVESLKEVVSAARIVCSSALSVPRTPLLIHEDFDVVIIDEAGQISQPAILGALVAADSFVLVGDHQQLPPLVTSQLAETGGKY